MSLESRQIHIDGSVGNIFNPRMPQTLAMPMGELVGTFQEAGYRGIEWHPLRTIAGLQMNLGLLSQSAKDGIVSLHQGYRNEKNWLQVWNHPNRSFAIASYIFLPETIKSVDNLERAQKVLGRKLPAVLYEDGVGTNRPFAEKLIQPSPDVMENWNVGSIEELIQQAYDRGYTGLCLDLFHMRRKNERGFQLGDWKQVFEAALPYTKEVHVSVERSDASQTDVDTSREFQELQTGRGDSPLMQMLRGIRESRQEMQTVVEMKNPFSSVKNWIQGNEAIVKSLQEILA